MVPSSLGCGSAVLAAMAMLAPSRAARSAIASPMPRDAPVMNSVLPLSDIGWPRNTWFKRTAASRWLVLSARAVQERLEGRLRLRRPQAFLEQSNLFVDVGHDLVR